MIRIEAPCTATDTYPSPTSSSSPLFPQVNRVLLERNVGIKNEGGAGFVAVGDVSAGTFLGAIGVTPLCDLLGMTAAIITLHAVPSPGELEAELAQLSARIDAATHRQLTLIRAIDEAEIWAAQGARSCAAWLGWRIGLGAGSARERVRVARALGELPAIDAAMSEGRVSFSKARALTRVATPENERDLLNMALASTAAQLERICSGLKRALDGEKEEAEVRVERFVQMRAMADGTREVRARLCADEAALLMEVLHRVREGLSRGCSSRGGEAPRPGLADALVRLVQLRSVQGGGAIEGAANNDEHVTFAAPREVVVHLEHDALGDLAATLDDGSRVPAETFRRVACDCALRCTLEGAMGAEGASDRSSIDVGRRTRSISPALRRALSRRDGGCRFPGCVCRRYLDAHHVEHWAHGGETTMSNLITLCTFHHQLLHEGGWQVRVEEGEFVFSDREGRVRDGLPPLAVAKGDLVASVGVLPTDADPTLTIGWDGRAVDYDHVIHALMN
ncbi:MAG: hypothetical protein ACI9KE_002590 [Polyangiales bacterium]|jgi:hypothetical protein